MKEIWDNINNMIYGVQGRKYLQMHN